jgi:hypothetical protein
MGQRNRRAFSSIPFLICLAALSCAACTRAELVDKANAYDEAIWDSSNKQILLNAVRASQRAPMSFVGFGDVLASPNFSGSAAGTFNLLPSSLTNYSLNPTVTYGGGFSSFTINNLNHSDFANAMHKPIGDKLISYFHHLNWPEEMVNLLLVHSIMTTKAKYALLKRTVASKCASDGTERTREICSQLDEDRAHDDACSRNEVETDGPELTILNSAREFCSMNRFQYAMRMYRLLDVEKFSGQPRSPEGILYYLGELIAAQNYSAQPYTPMTLIASGGTRHLVKLFVVERGVSADAAVQVFSHGEGFYIPRPQLGAVDEERSLQVLDLVSQAIIMATSKDSLPKTNTVSLVAVH